MNENRQVPCNQQPPIWRPPCHLNQRLGEPATGGYNGKLHATQHRKFARPKENSDHEELSLQRKSPVRCRPRRTHRRLRSISLNHQRLLKRLLTSAQRDQRAGACQPSDRQPRPNNDRSATTGRAEASKEARSAQSTEVHVQWPKQRRVVPISQELHP